MHDAGSAYIARVEFLEEEMGTKTDAPGKVLWTKEQIQRRVDELAAEISASFNGGNLLCLVVLRGGFFFAADLIRGLKGFDRIEIDFVRLSSYAGTSPGGEVKFRGQLPKVAGDNVLVIEDLTDTGATMHTLADALRASGAAQVKYAVLVDKTARRNREFHGDFVAFKIDRDDFLVGYGMDLNDNFRALPSICSVPAAK